ncbi:MAG TPA: hypothetical protein PKZ97_08290 [Azospirillaceae bacterium]|nr:hypothetical protein [Azospirillaceae bacterium]HRQ81104.1 hypothetical protein [Azospirillaceae bacterium]
MFDDFSAKPLALNKINQAYALVRTTRPDLTADGWRALATEYIAESSAEAPAARGVVAVQTDQGYIVGLFCYAACDDMRHGPTLRIENLIALDLFDQAGVMAALLDEIEALARRLQRRAVVAEQPACSRPDSESGRLVAAWFADSDDPAQGLLRLLSQPSAAAMSEETASEGVMSAGA